MAEQFELNLQQATDMVAKLRSHVEESIFGQEDLITEALCCLLSGGHILMTGAPGLAKTTLVRVIASELGLNFGRVQFTPDLLPSDIIGSEILNIDPSTSHRSFDFSPGPLFTNLLLADEINRASPRTQSALLEAMQERACTVGGKRHVLEQPFMVFATQNPFESEGTFPLPEAQLDRFLLHSIVEYPSESAETKILTQHVSGQLVGEATSSDKVRNPLSKDQIRHLIASCSKIEVDSDLIAGIRDLVRSTRPEDENCPDKFKNALWYGAGPRAGISLVSTARSMALLEGSEVVRWKHVRRLAKPVLRHRLRLTAQAGRDELNEDDVISYLLDRLEERHRNLAKGIG